MITPEELKEIRERCEMATPGRWYWNGFKKKKDISLVTTFDGHSTIMDFVRWGTGGASPRFRKDDLMVRADSLIIPRQAHRPDGEFYKLDHPDADFIAHARTDIPRLLDEVDRLSLDLVSEIGFHEQTKKERNELIDEVERLNNNIRKLERWNNTELEITKRQRESTSTIYGQRYFEGAILIHKKLKQLIDQFKAIE